MLLNCAVEEHIWNVMFKLCLKSYGRQASDSGVVQGICVSIEASAVKLCYFSIIAGMLCSVSGELRNYMRQSVLEGVCVYTYANSCVSTQSLLTRHQ